MRLELTGRHIEITPSMRRIVDGKLARLERLLNDTAVSAQVVFSKEKTGSRADVTLHARGEKFLHGAGRGANWQAAVGAAFDKIAQQALKVKGKWDARKRQISKAAARSAVVDVVAPSRTAARPRTIMPPVVESPRQTVRPLSLPDASRQLGANGHVLVFRNADTLVVSVLYRTNGGELVLVETDA
jgi:putative sigma-54 modulation protein